MTSETEALEAIDGILGRGGDADDVLREVVEVVHDLYPYAAIALVERDELVVGPAAGTPTGALEKVPVEFQGVRVAELQVGGAPVEGRFLEQVAARVSPYCLVAWDTRGEAWDA